VLAALSAYELREAWPEVLIEVARYAAESRQPWSEPPILDPPSIDDAPLKLRDAVDRLAAEKWLAAHMNTDELLDVAADRIDAFLITSAAVKLADVLGEKGRYAALRIGIQEIWSVAAMPPLWAGEKEDLKDQLLANTMAERGSIESVNSYLLYEEGKSNKKVRSYLASLDELTH